MYVHVDKDQAPCMLGRQSTTDLHPQPYSLEMAMKTAQGMNGLRD